MDAALVPQLSALLALYYEPEEFFELAQVFGIPQTIVEYQPETKADWLRIARRLVESVDQGNTHAFLTSLVDQFETRNAHAIATSKFERRAPHEEISPAIVAWRSAMLQEPSSGEVAVVARRPFTAKSEIRELLATATTPILIVDPYVGVGTLDCLRNVSTPVRLLTATVEPGFDRVLADFKNEGFQIEVRLGVALHDRHLCFNDRLWLVGSSLKDAGKKAFNITETIDTKAAVVLDLETRWKAGTLYP